MKVDIIICVWNKKDITKDCIESIYRNTRYPHRLILIDNASDKDTEEYLQSVKDDKRFEVLLIRNEENLGNTKAINQGLAAAKAPYICNLDNDTYVTNGWLAECIRIAETDEKIGMVTPAGRGGDPPQDHSLEGIERWARKLESRRGKMKEMALIDCCHVVFRKSMVDDIGLWDEIFSPGYFDDTEYCRRARNKGYRLVCALGAYAYHREGGSFKKNPRRQEIWDRNEKIYKEKYGESRRVVFIVSKYSENKFRIIEEKSLDHANNTNWVRILKKNGLPRLNIIDHSHIKRIYFNSFLFYFMTIYMVLVRVKKRYDVIYTDNNFIKSILSLTKFLHKSKICLL